MVVKATATSTHNKTHTMHIHSSWLENLVHAVRQRAHPLFRKLSIHHLRIINEQRRVQGLPDVPIGNTVRRSCYLKAHNYSQELDDSSESEAEEPATPVPVQPGQVNVELQR
jgi:hypothetical protein